MKGYLTTIEAAGRLNVSRRFILSLCARKWGRQGAQKVGRDWLIPQAVVEKYARYRPGPGRPRKAKE